MNCPGCGIEVSDDSVFCSRCGARVQNACHNCGEVNTQGSVYCWACGASLAVRPAVAAAISGPVCPQCRLTNAPDEDECFYCGARLRANILAEFWRRLGALLIDIVILALVEIMMDRAAAHMALSRYFETDFWTRGLGQYFTDLRLSQTILALYFTIGVSVWSTTLGKKALGLRVLRLNGSRIGVGRALTRFLAHFLPFFLFAELQPFFLSIAFLVFLPAISCLMIAFRQDKRGLHDLICDTVVVKQ